MKTKIPLAALTAALTVLTMPAASAAMVQIDLSTKSGSAAGWDVFSADVTDAAVTDQNAVDNDVTLTITGIAGVGNNGAPGTGATIDTFTVPKEARDDYVWGSNPGSILFEFKNLDAGSYNVSVFEGHTADLNQEGALWVGLVGDEPAQNTGNYAGGDSTVEVTVGAGDSLFFRHFPGADWTGGTSGIIVNPIPEPSTTALLGLGGLALILRRRK